MSQIKESSNLLESVRPTEAASSDVINLFDEEGCSGGAADVDAYLVVVE